MDTLRSPARRAVILAAGRGTRMRREHRGVPLGAAQRDAASRGTKGLVPFHGEPFLAYVLSALADGGITEACLVVGPGDDPIRAHFSHVRSERLRLEFAEQQEPLGSANALLAAESATGDQPFIVVNADNLYPAVAIARVRAIEGHGMAGFRAQGLVAGGIPAERIAAFALVTTDTQGNLTQIIEKPEADTQRLLARGALVSMTC